jgi:hypothetical protein
MAHRSRRQRERSRRLWAFLAKAGLLLAIVAAASAFAYDVGQHLAVQEIATLRGDIATLSTTSEEQQDTIGQLRGDLVEAQEEARTYRQRYEDVAPEAIGEVIAAVRDRLDDGLAPERIAFAVRQAQPPHDCSPTQTRRFIARTENYDGANTWVRFNDLVTVTGSGQAGAGGTAEWYDPAQPVTLTFTPLGGTPQTVDGPLPLDHAMVVKGREYRFTATPGPRSFIEVTADWCAWTD